MQLFFPLAFTQIEELTGSSWVTFILLQIRLTSRFKQKTNQTNETLEHQTLESTFLKNGPTWTAKFQTACLLTIFKCLLSLSPWFKHPSRLAVQLWRLPETLSHRAPHRTKQAYDNPRRKTLVRSARINTTGAGITAVCSSSICSKQFSLAGKELLWGWLCCCCWHRAKAARRGQQAQGSCTALTRRHPPGCGFIGCTCVL